MTRRAATAAGAAVVDGDLESALAASERMLDGALTGDWPSVSALQQERARHLAGFAAPPGAGGQVRLLLKRMQDINEQIRELASSHRDALALRNRELRAGTRATSAYERAAG